MRRPREDEMDDAIFVSWTSRSTVHGEDTSLDDATGARMIPAAAQASAAHLAAAMLVGDDALVTADEFSAHYQLGLRPVSGT